MEWMSCKELAAATGHSYEAVRKALRNAHDAPQPRTVRGRLLEMKTMRASSATSAENVSAVLATTLLWRTI